MNRRDATFAIALSPFTLDAGPARAQATNRVVHLGYLSQPTRESVAKVLDAFLHALRDLGWIEGRNLTIEYRWAEGNAERLPELARELVQQKVDLIVAPSGSAALAAKGATSTIPIVMIFPADPVEIGLVTSLSRPGGNVTGTTYSAGQEIVGRQLQILREAIPRATRIAVLSNRLDPGWMSRLQELENAARSMHLRLQHCDAKGPADFDAAFAAMARERAEGLMIAGSSSYLVHRVRLGELAIKHRLPTMTNFREMVEGGCMMAYSVNMVDFIARAARYVDRILRGAKPADLPVEQPTVFELVINMKTARAIGLALPRPLVLRADYLVE